MKKIALFLSMVIAAAAHASDWKLIALGDSYDYFVDISSISEMGNGIRQYWGRRQFKKPYMVNGKAALSAIEFNEIDCRGHTVRLLEATLFDSFERSGVVASLEASEKDRIAPDSIGEMIEKTVCKK